MVGRMVLRWSALLTGLLVAQTAAAAPITLTGNVASAISAMQCDRYQVEQSRMWTSSAATRPVRIAADLDDQLRPGLGLEHQ